MTQLVSEETTGVYPANRDRCKDGGKCHHSCTDGCFREKYCVPLSGSGLDDNWNPNNPIPLLKNELLTIDINKNSHNDIGVL